MINRIKAANKLPYIIIIMMTLLLAQIAPYNTHQIGGFLARLAYWGSIIIVSWLSLIVVDKPLKALFKWPYFIIGSISTLLMTIPLTAYIILINVTIVGDNFYIDGILSFWLQIVITSQCVFLLIYFTVHNVVKLYGGSEEMAKSSPLFLKKIAGELLYIKSEDHYLRIVTTAENKLILYKLKDAMHQLEASHIDGMMIHRSHWVAKSAIKSHKKDGRKNLLVLSNDDVLPVSATFFKNLKGQDYV